MIKIIKYVCTFDPDYLTCHAIFSHVTNNQLKKIEQNAYIQKPKFKVYFEDRIVTLIYSEESFNEIKDSEKISLYHNGKEHYALKINISNYIFENNKTNIGDYVTASGVISMAKKLTIIQKIDNPDKIILRKNICPVDSLGNFIAGEKQRTLDYLQKSLGIDLKTKNSDSREFRFEMISWRHLHKGKSYKSKSNPGNITLHNVFYFYVNGFVNNIESFNNLNISSIGKKRSYGLGNIQTSIINE